MTTKQIIELTTPILGFLGVIIPIIRDIVKGRKISTNKKSKWIPSTIKINYFIIISFFVLISSISFFSYKYFKCNCHSKISIKIINPKNESEINNKFINIYGKYNNLDSNDDIWIFVYSYSDKVFYPHFSSAVKLKKNKWINENTEIGTIEDIGNRFDIYALVIRKNSDSYDKIVEVINNESLTSLSKIPSHILSDYVTVILK